MWFKRAPKNRHLGREFVLDVKLRSSQVRARRARMVAVALGGLFAAVACVLLAWRATEWTLNVLLYENKVFAIKELDVQTDGVIARDQLRRWSGVRPGQNLFALDLESIRRNLLLVPAIQSVSLEKIFPHTLRLRVLEREPLARLSIAMPRANGGVELVPFFLDADGYAMVPLTSSQCTPGAPACPTDQLPLIVGVTANEVQPGRCLDSPQVRSALQFLQVFQRSPMSSVEEIKKIDVASPEVLLVKTALGSDITFGLADPDRQILRWQAIFEHGQGIKKAIATLDLAVSDSIPLTWAETGAVTQVSVKLTKPLRNKKKHV